MGPEIKDRDTVLVTGGAGFIGSAVVRELLKTERFVVNVDALTYAGHRETLSELENNPFHCFVEADICDSKIVEGLLREHSPQAIIHLAAETHVDRSIDTPESFVQTNVVGTLRLLEAARTYLIEASEQIQNVFRFLHVSTDEVFGELGDTGLFTETTPYSPRSPYAASKAASDHLVRAWGNTYNLPVLITNCSNNYGPHQFPEKLIPLTILNAIRGATLPIYGDGSNIRDWLFVNDHAQAITAVLEKGRLGETYNVGGDAQKTNLQVVKKICAVLDHLKPRQDGASYTDQIKFVADRPGHDFRYAIDSSKLKQELGWCPQHEFDAGIQETVAWYLANGSWCEAVNERGGYKQQRLGLKQVML